MREINALHLIMFSVGPQVCVRVCVQGQSLLLKTRTAHFTPPAAPQARLMRRPQSSKTDKERSEIEGERDSKTEIERPKLRGLKTAGDIQPLVLQKHPWGCFSLRFGLSHYCHTIVIDALRWPHRPQQPLHHQFQPVRNRRLYPLFCLCFSHSHPLCFAERFAWETLVSFHVRISSSLFQFQRVRMCACVREMGTLDFHSSLQTSVNFWRSS